MRALQALLPATTLATGLMAGFFFAYSFSIVPGLAETAPDAAMAAMQGVNRAVRNPVFGTVFFGTAALCGLVLAAAALGAVPWVGAAAAGVYLGGAFAVTVLVNVPLNAALAAADPAAPAAAEAMGRYLGGWGAWNDLRSVASALAFALLVVALRRAPIIRSGA